MTSYAIIIERAGDGGYGAWCPALPGCVALADTPDETATEMAAAIELHLAGMRADGVPVPPGVRPTTHPARPGCPVTIGPYPLVSAGCPRSLPSDGATPSTWPTPT